MAKFASMMLLDLFANRQTHLQNPLNCPKHGAATLLQYDRQALIAKQWRQDTILGIFRLHIFLTIFVCNQKILCKFVFEFIQLKGSRMEKVVVQINNNSAFNLLENLEALNVIKVLKRIPYSQSENPDRAARLSEIQLITGNIHIDLSNFQFNRDEANNYD